MLQEFYQWYTITIKNNPTIIIVGSIVALFAAIGSIYGGIQAMNSFLNFIKIRYFENQILYEKLGKINTSLTIDFVNSIIGEPAIVKKLPMELVDYVKTENNKWTEKKYTSGLEGYTEMIYVHKKYFVQIIVDKDKRVVSYAVTTRDKTFNPKIPIEIYHSDKSGKIYPYISNLKLGKMKLNDLKDYKPEDINIGNWGMHLFYIESNYFGNPGFYKHYLLAVSPSGCCVDENTGYKLVELRDEEEKSTKNNKILELRNTIIPNTFAAMDGWENESLHKYFIKEGIGPNYYDIREF